MDSPKVSVIIPTYNRPAFLAQAVHSVLEQTFPVFEVIIVDDGSSAIHHSSISALEGLDERIRIYYFRENRGVSAARNYGLEKSTGDFVLFLDDDDLLHQEMVHSCLEMFHKKSGIDVVACWHGVFYDSSSPSALDVDNKRSDELLQSILYIQDYVSFPSIEEKPFSALIRMCLQVSSCLIKRESIKGIRFPEELERGEDYFFWLTLAAAGCRFRTNNECLAFHRIHSFSSLSHSGTVRDVRKLYHHLLTGGMVRQKQDLMLTHFRYSLRLRSFDKLSSLYQATMFLRYFLQPSVFREGYHHILQTFLMRFSRRWRRLEEVRRIILALRNSPP